MGGHGGLNILPQKSWNVYGRENRLKVSQDEAKYEEEQRGKRQKHEQAERETRRKLLLQRARERDGLPAEPELNQEQPLVPAQPAAQPFSLFSSDDLAADNSEVVEAKRDEHRQRGKADTRTSDPKFDARFKLGYQLSNKGNEPWYARLSETDLASNISRPGPATHLPQGQMLPPSGTSAAAASNSALPALPNGQQSHNEKKVHKQKHKHKHRHKETKSPSRGVSKCSKSKASLLQGVAKEQVLAAMREERANREASERGRQAELVRREAPAAKPSVPRGPAQRYHSSYGNSMKL